MSEEIKCKYDRTKKVIFSKKDIVSTIAYLGIQQSPELYPYKLLEALKKVDKKVSPLFKGQFLGRKKMTLKRLYKYLKELIFSIPEIENWNLSKAEREKGISVNAPSRPKYAFTSRYSKSSEEYDFIDLDALYRNVAHQIYDTQVK